jgi:hypothetical protein
MTLEVKSGHDDPIRGIGQLAEALAHGYNSAALVMSLRHAKRLDRRVFRDGLAMLGVDLTVGSNPTGPHETARKRVEIVVGVGKTQKLELSLRG